MPASHGKHANVFSLRPNGFKGTGKNDAAWGPGFSGAASALYEVVIDGTGAPDTFKWRKNGGAWTTLVALTGAAQTLDDGQTISFGSTSGHTAGDQWVIGNLKEEPCTEAGQSAQITDAARRILNPDSAVTFTDSGGANLVRIDHADGRAYFDSAVTIVTATGKNGFLPESMLERAGYLYEWSLEVSVELADATPFQEHWKRFQAGQAQAAGSAAGYLAGRKWFEAFEDCAGGSQALFFLQLFTRDPANDQSGDRVHAWVVFDGFNPAAPLTEMVKEAISFKVHGLPVFKLGV